MSVFAVGGSKVSQRYLAMDNYNICLERENHLHRTQLRIDLMKKKYEFYDALDKH